MWRYKVLIYLLSVASWRYFNGKFKIPDMWLCIVLLGMMIRPD